MTKELPSVRVIILSRHATEEYVWQALRAELAGYLLKDTTPPNSNSRSHPWRMESLT